MVNELLMMNGQSNILLFCFYVFKPFINTNKIKKENNLLWFEKWNKDQQIDSLEGLNFIERVKMCWK